MTENKNALQNESENLNNTNIIAQNADNSNNKRENSVAYQNLQDIQKLFMPSIIEETLKDFIFPLFPDIKLSLALNTLIALTSTVCGHKYIAFDEYGDKLNVKFPNIYALNFAQSGMGKDRLKNNLQSKIFKPITDDVYWQIKYYIKTEKEKINKEAAEIEDPELKREFLNKNKVRNVEIEVSNATVEGFCEDCKATIKAHKNCMLCFNNEFGLFLIEKDERQKQFVNIIIPAYDGGIRMKSTKGENREKNLEGIFLNVLFYTDPTILKENQVSILFNYLLGVGFIRRFFIAFQDTMSFTIEKDGKKQREKEKQAYINAKSISKKFYEIWDKIKPNSIYVLTDETDSKALHPYKLKISELCKQVNNPFLYREIQSRIFKVLKLSTIFASINHPTELIIKGEDVNQAISIVEYIAKDFVKFLSFFQDDNNSHEEKLFYFLQQNLGKEFTKTDIAHTHFKKFGYKKNTDISNDKAWEKLIDDTQIVANSNGYILVTKNHNGWKIKLEKILKDDETPDDLTSLDDVI